MGTKKRPMRPDDRARSIDESFEGLVNESDHLRYFDEAIYDLLPDHLALFMELFEKQEERDTALFSVLVLLSGVLPNYTVLYDGKVYEANLFGYVCGPFGSGKGVINTCKALVSGIHKEKRKRSAEKYQQFQIQEKAQKKRKNGKKAILDDSMPEADLPDPNVDALFPPPDEMLLIPANNTKSNLFKILYENNGRGIICETEAATLTTALKQQHGSFLDLILLAFHHETSTYSRKAERTTEIEHPYLSVLLSSTPKQIFHLFPDIENGLFSRFVFCWTKSSPEFKPVFSGNTDSSFATVTALSEEITKLYNYLEGKVGNPVAFAFTHEQQVRFHKHFQKLKNSYREIYQDQMDGVIHRLGLIFTRVAMILAMFRRYGEATSSAPIGDDAITCTDQDYNTTVLLTNTLLENSAAVYELMVKSRNAILNSMDSSPEQRMNIKKECVELRLQGVSYAEIARRVLKDANLKGTVHKLVNKKTKR